LGGIGGDKGQVKSSAPAARQEKSRPDSYGSTVLQVASGKEGIEKAQRVANYLA